MTNPEVLAFTVPDACKALGIGRTNLYRLIGEGQLQARALGGRTVIPAESLRAFMAGLPPAAIRPRPPAGAGA